VISNRLCVEKKEPVRRELRRKKRGKEPVLERKKKVGGRRELETEELIALAFNQFSDLGPVIASRPVTASRELIPSLEMIFP
jgi:hypothetical protein